MQTRRDVIAAGSAGIATLGLAGAPASGAELSPKATYGLVGQMKAQPGQRDALIAILAEGTDAMPGCVAYIVGADLADADGIWITELWTSKDAHAASLKLPAVQEAIRKGRPLIAGMGAQAEFKPA